MRINILLAAVSAAKLSFPWKLPGHINSEIITLKTLTSKMRKQNPTTQVFHTSLYPTSPAATKLQVLHHSSISETTSKHPYLQSYSWD